MNGTRFQYAPAEIIFKYYKNSDNALQEMENLLKQQICLVCYEKPLTAKEIGTQIGCAKEYVDDSMIDLCNLHLIKKENGKYSTNFNFLPHYDFINAMNKTTELMVKNNFPKEFSEITLKLEPQIRKFDFYGNDFEYNYLLWIIYGIAFRILNTIIVKKYVSSKGYELSSWTEKDYYLLGLYKLVDDDRFISLNDKLSLLNHYSLYNYYELPEIGIIEARDVLETNPLKNTESENQNNTTNRINIFTINTIGVIFKIIDGKTLLPKETEITNDLIQDGLICKDDNGKLKVKIPVITRNIYEELSKLLESELDEFAEKIVKTIGYEIEKLLLPLIRKSDRELLESFFVFDFAMAVSPSGSCWKYSFDNNILSKPDTDIHYPHGLFIIK